MGKEKLDRKKLEEKVTDIIEGFADKFRAAGIGNRKVKGDNFTMTHTENSPKPSAGHPVQFRPGESNVDAIEKDEKEVGIEPTEEDPK